MRVGILIVRWAKGHDAIEALGRKAIAGEPNYRNRSSVAAEAMETTSASYPSFGRLCTQHDVHRTSQSSGPCLPICSLPKAGGSGIPPRPPLCTATLEQRQAGLESLTTVSKWNLLSLPLDRDCNRYRDCRPPPPNPPRAGPRLAFLCQYTADTGIEHAIPLIRAAVDRKLYLKALATPPSCAPGSLLSDRDTAHH
jgi:hypothetical protein